MVIVIIGRFLSNRFFNTSIFRVFTFLVSIEVNLPLLDKFESSGRSRLESRTLGTWQPLLDGLVASAASRFEIGDTAC